MTFFVIVRLDTLTKLRVLSHKFTEVLLEDLKTMNPGVNVIGFRLASNSDFKGFVRRYDDTMTEDSYKKIKKEQVCCNQDQWIYFLLWYSFIFS